ncbi:MAG: hypothetical protein N3A66_11370, partial [Planctomycetota bacterium]|nr:hypothetical protein [Planctomycetota bacterium]
YELLDTSVQRNAIYAYRLEEVNLWGSRSCPHPPAIAQAKGVKANLAKNAAQPVVLVRGYESAAPGSLGSWRQERFTPAARQWAKYSGPLARIETEAEGLVRIPQADLLSMGFSPQGRFALFSQGRSVEHWLVSPDGQNRDLCFYAPAYRTLYSRKNVFWLGQISDRGGALFVDSAVVSSALPSGAMTDYEAVSRFEEDKIYAGNLPNSSPLEDHFFCAGYLAAGRSISRTLFCAEVISDQPAKVRLLLRSYSPTSPSSHVQVLVNDTAVGEFKWNGARRYLAEAVVPAGILRPGANAVTLRSYGDTGATLEITYTDWVEIAYRRPLRLENGQVRFKFDSAKSRPVAVSGIASPRVVLVEVQGNTVRRLPPVKLRRAKDGYQAIFEGKPGAVYC